MTQKSIRIKKKTAESLILSILSFWPHYSCYTYIHHTHIPDKKQVRMAFPQVSFTNFYFRLLKRLGNNLFTGYTEALLQRKRKRCSLANQKSVWGFLVLERQYSREGACLTHVQAWFHLQYPRWSSEYCWCSPKPK